MSFQQQLKQTFQKEFSFAKGEEYNYAKLYRSRLVEFRKEKKAVVRIEKPTNLAKARALGYKAKQGFVVVRARVRKGSGLHRRPVRARRPKRMGVTKLTRKKSIQGIAEIRAARRYPNLEVLNSYWVGEDGKNKYFEIILVDPNSPSIKSDREINWICSGKHKGRAERGLTSAGKKGRGLRRKGEGAEKVRPSLRAKERKAK